MAAAPPADDAMLETNLHPSKEAGPKLPFTRTAPPTFAVFPKKSQSIKDNDPELLSMIAPPAESAVLFSNTQIKKATAPSKLLWIPMPPPLFAALVSNLQSSKLGLAPPVT